MILRSRERITPTLPLLTSRIEESPFKSLVYNNMYMIHSYLHPHDWYDHDHQYVIIINIPMITIIIIITILLSISFLHYR